jgi:hypothetical protein
MTDADLTAGQVFGAWTLVAVDDTGKRVVVRCTCGVLRQLARGALIDSRTMKGCGCSATREPRNDGPPVSDDTRAAFSSASRWHRGGTGH